jgi:hypothetical protein
MPEKYSWGNGKSCLHTKKVWGMVPFMNTTSEIIDWIGEAVVLSRFGVTKDRIKQVRDDNRFPASWLHGLETLAGRPLPRDRFRFKEPKE